MNEIYEFIREKYVGRWNEFLHQISRFSSPEEEKTFDWVRRQMIGSTEYFVLLHILWAARLRDEDRAGLSLHTITERCQRLRALSDGIIANNVQFLAKNGLLEASVGERPAPILVEGPYRLKDACLAAFDQYSSEFLPMREAFKARLQQKFHLLAAPRQ